MPLTWSPDPSVVPWSDVQAQEVWIESPITAADAEALLTVVGYRCQILGPEPLERLRIQTSSQGVIVSAPTALPDVFQPLDIEYQIRGVTGHCRTFADLPPQADEVIRFTPNPVNTKDWTLRITADCADTASGAVHAFSADFVLRVWANFDPGRDALREAVRARRR